MDTFLLSPEPVVAQSTKVAKTSPSAKETSGEEFSPALDNAVTGLKQEEQNDTDTGDAGEENPLTQASVDLETANQATENISHVQSNGAEGMFGNASLSPAENSAVALNTSLNSLTDKGIIQTPAQTVANISANNLETPVTLSTISTLNQEGNSPTKTSDKAETILLNQIQQILDEGKEKGTIVIKGTSEGTASQKESATHLSTLSSPVLANATENASIQAKQNIVQTDFSEEHSKPVPAVPATRTESTRQDVTEQYLNAKMDGSGKTRNDPSQQQQEHKGSDGQNKNSLQQVISSNSTSTAPESSSGESAFGQQLGLGSSFGTSSTLATPLSIEGKFAPGANILVPEQEIVDTLIQKFNVNPRLQTSKLTMQLHPAELGALKIDIAVKDGTISAHIVAQSQQVMETLDKNITRLREVLRDQGFQVEDFKITLETDRETEQQLFQEQFESKQQDFVTGESIMDSEVEIFDTLLMEQDVSEYSTNQRNSVNLTA